MSEELDDPIHEDLDHEENETDEEVEGSGEDDAEGDREGPDGDSSNEEDESRDGEENEGVPKRVGRREQAVLNAKKERETAREDAKKAREEAETARREIQEIKAQQQETQRRREEDESLKRREFMTPDEIRADDLTRRLDKIESEAKFQQFVNWDNSDRQAFNTEVSQSKVASRLASKVEAEYERLAVQNRTPTSRMAIYWLLRGQESSQRERVVVKKARETGERNIRKQTVRPGNAKSTVAASGVKDERQARLERLAGKSIWT